jgi:hypothetical protein
VTAGAGIADTLSPRPLRGNQKVRPRRASKIMCGGWQDRSGQECPLRKNVLEFDEPAGNL